MSSSLKEKWLSDSGPRGNAKAGGRGRVRGAALERMGARCRRGRHWGPAVAPGCAALHARPEKPVIAGTASTLVVLAPGTTPVAPQGTRSRALASSSRV